MLIRISMKKKKNLKMTVKNIKAWADWWSREQQKTEERVDTSGEAALLFLLAYRLKTSRCSSVAEFRRGEMKTPLTLVSSQKSYHQRETICPPCELFHFCQHIVKLQVDIGDGLMEKLIKIENPDTHSNKEQGRMNLFFNKRLCEVSPHFADTPNLN